MIDFREIIGHEKPITILKNRIKYNKVGQAYLFAGKDGIGKKSVAIAFSKAINCKNLSNEQNPCNKCSACLTIEKGTNPDVDIISPVDSVIKIEKIRELKSNIFYQPIENKKKVYIIDEADKMTLEASNSLLKVLEEPPGYAVLVLITAFPDSILPTILSRCCKLSFKPLSNRQQLEILLRQKELNLDEKQLKEIIKLSYGSPGIVMQRIADKQKITLQKTYIKQIAQLRPVDMLDCIFNPENYFPEINDNFLYFVEVMILWFRDILYLKKDMNIKYLVFQEEINAIKRYAQYYSENNLMNILEYLSIIPEELKRHINKNTLLENFFIRLGD
jgi:DNA polymerase-3 subunit delta'